MININQMQQVGNSWAPTIYNYRFPTIDFNFQNTGNATASLWQFSICVLKAEIDPTPVLNFKVDIEESNLVVIATNNGWGTAYNCEIQIKEPILSHLFVDSELQYKGEIASGDSVKVLSLSKKPGNAGLFEELKKDYVDVFHYAPTPPFNQTIKGINLGLIDVMWICKDSKGDTFQDQERIQPNDWDGDFVITDIGFFKTRNPRSGGGAYSDITFSAIIDPLKGAQEYKYPFRRKIPPGDTERFHIMIAASMSCYIRVKLEFYIDQTKVIESKEFDIEIWNPRNSQWHYPYRDGEELRRNIEQSKDEISRYSNDRDKEQALAGLERLQQRTSDYPFLKRENSNP
jgi:hypothetical protein